MTFAEIRAQALLRFNQGMAEIMKEWVRKAYLTLWELDDWTFRRTTLDVTVTAGSQRAGTDVEIGTPTMVLDPLGGQMRYLPLEDFWRCYYGASATGIPDTYTVDNGVLYVGPIPNQTGSYRLVHNRPPGYFASNTLTGAHTFPTGTITLASNAEFPTSGLVLVGERDTVTYTGKGGSTLTGCSGGTRSFPDATRVVSLTPQAGVLTSDSDVPMLPMSTHMLLVFGAQTVGQALEGDWRADTSSDYVRAELDAMRRNYLAPVRGEYQAFGGSLDYDWASSWR